MVETDQTASLEGELVAGKYIVRRRIGEGGMGVVVEAQHMQLGHRVALKFLSVHLAKDPTVAARFLREGQSAVQLESEHVARMLDVGTRENGEPFLAMEFLEGADLADIVSRAGPLPIGEAVAHTLQACDAVAEAHSIGVVHRDLKPANLFLAKRRDGSAVIKVLDFGIAKVVEGQAGAASITATNMVMGSPQYMSPEQLRSTKQVDARADIWALGTILFELLTGRAPHAGDTLTEVCAKIASDPAPPLRQLRPDAPPQLEAIILRCLEKDPAKRPQSVAAFASELVPFGPSWASELVARMTRLAARAAQPRTILGVPSHVVAGATVGRSTAGAWSGAGGEIGEAEPRRRARVVVAVAGVAVISLVAALTAVVLATGDESDAVSGSDTLDAPGTTAPVGASSRGDSGRPGASGFGSGGGSASPSPSSIASGASPSGTTQAVAASGSGRSAPSAPPSVAPRAPKGASTAAPKPRVSDFGGRE